MSTTCCTKSKSLDACDTKVKVKKKNWFQKERKRHESPTDTKTDYYFVFMITDL